MKKSLVIALTALAVVLSYGVSGVLAQGDAEQKAPESVGVKIVGTNYCLLQTLAKSEMAAANSAYAMINALKVTEATGADGTAMPELVGKTLHYLPSKSAEPLFVGEAQQNKKVTVIGRLFKNESALLVEEFESEAGGGDEWEGLPTGKKSAIQVL